MRYREILKKSGLIALIVFILVATGLVPYSHQVAADDLSLFEEPVLIPSSEQEYVPDQIIVKFKEGILSVAEESLNQRLGISVVHTSPRGGFKVLKIPKGKTVAEMVATYRKQAIVEYAEPNYYTYATWAPNDPSYPLQWHFYNAVYGGINLEAAWDLDTTAPLYGGDPSIVVAVIDTGVAYETYDVYVQAPDLANTNFWVNSGEIAGNSLDDDGNGYIDDINGWDFINTDAHPNDDNNHGTHVTGTIAQSTNNDLGVAGIAFNTTIMPIKVWDSDGSGTYAQTADGFYYAADNGANIINYSGGGTFKSDTLKNAVAYARNAGVVIIAAAGNEKQFGNRPLYPAAYDEYVIAVGATRYDETRSYYSNTGTYLDVAAPGGDTTVDQNGDGYADGVLQQTFASGDPTSFDYYFFQGTSMATPHAVGVAALILAKNPTWTAAQVRHALQSTAEDKGTSGWDEDFGWGLIDAYAAVNASLPAWDSYSDSGHTTECNNFSDYDTEHTVYMYGTGFLPSHAYRVAYYDGINAKVATDDVDSDASGNLSSQHTFVDGTDEAGTWNVIVSERAHTPPATYSSTWTYTIASDSFTVEQSAIPEFPTVLVAIVALALSAGIYLWMRRKAAPASLKSPSWY